MTVLRNALRAIALRFDADAALRHDASPFAVM